MRIGLTLGGGGARGSAHIGVFMEFERLGIRPSLITGTSIGGMLGALMAAGLSTEEIVAFFQKITIGNMYALPGGLPAISHNNKFRTLLEKTLGDITFADLPIPLAVVTTDLTTRKMMILDEGNLVDAILATIAIPVLFPPVTIEGHVLADGGMLNNVPFDVARARGATYVIAVTLSNTAPYGTPEEENVPLPDVLSRALAFTKRRLTLQAISTMHDIWTDMTLNARMAIAQPDVLLRPHMGTIGIFDTHRMQEGIRAGQAAVREVEQKLLKDLINPELNATV